jgi:hypothetical protein
MVPYACVSCRRSFKRRRSWPLPDKLACSHCGEEALRVSQKFKPPARDDVRQWNKVSALLRAGFRFESVGEPYPKTLSEVSAFAARHPRKPA